MNTTEVIPVIHYLDDDQVLRNANIAFESGCNSVMLINMNGSSQLIIPVLEELKTIYKDKKIGANFLDAFNPNQLPFNVIPNLDMTWTDVQLTYSLNTNHSTAESITNLLEERDNHQLFCAVAFKYQPHEPDPIKAAFKALDYGFIPTTSGSATGVSADPKFVKMIRMWMNENSPLAIASGITPDNVIEFLPYVSHILVSTGISESFYEFDPIKLRDLFSTTISFIK